MALREYLVLTPEIRDALRRVEPEDLVPALRDWLQKRGMPIERAAEDAYRKGQITEETYHRMAGRVA